MQTVRQQFDADLARTNEPTDYRTELNIHPLNCGVCGQVMYVDQETFDRNERAVECDQGNQLVCMDCEQTYEDQANAQR